jgi:hypothetical protein
MLTSVIDSACKKTMPYYFDMLSGTSSCNVPSDIISHVQQCSFCKNGIERLRLSFSEFPAGDAVQKQRDQAVINSLELQYAFNGVTMNCLQVKPFLPIVADNLLTPRTATPVTGHLDNCKSCLGNLGIIQRFNLTHIQLCRLGQMFAENQVVDARGCDKAKAYVDSIVGFDLEGVPSECLRHVSLCRKCRNLIRTQWSRKTRAISSQKSFHDECHITDTNLFDFAVPYGAKPETNREKLLKSHLASCRQCVGRALALHDNLFAIRDSNVVSTETRFVTETVEDFSTAKPFHVEVIRPSALNYVFQKLSTARVSSFLKPAAAAAILFAMVFYLSSSANAISLSQIYAVIAKSLNLHIVSYGVDVPKPLQEQWILRSEKKSISITSSATVLWDLNACVVKTKHPDSSAIDLSKLPYETIQKVSKEQDGSLGLMPFTQSAELPEGARWTQEDNTKSAFSTNIKVYDLIWSDKNPNGSTVTKKWRVFVDLKTDLPKRVEWYAGSAGGVFRMTSYALVDYPNIDEAKQLIESFK